MLSSVKRARGARPGFWQAALVASMEGVNEAGRMGWKRWSAEVAWLLKIVDARVGYHLHIHPLLTSPCFTCSVARTLPVSCITIAQNTLFVCNVIYSFYLEPLVYCAVE